MTEIKTKSRDTKSLLAKLMASEDINVEYRNNISTAAFNTENRTLLMPVFKDISENTTDLFLGHEVGHALFTPTGVIKDVMAKGGTFKSLVNIVEDARIEKMIQSKFPGLRRNFFEGYAELMDKNFFGLNGEDVNDLNFIDRINIHFKLGTRAGVEFSDVEQAYVDRIANLRSWDDTIKVSEELEEYCKGTDEDLESDTSGFDFSDFDEDENEPGDEGDDSEQPDMGQGTDDDSEDTDEDDDGETSDEAPEDSNSDDPAEGDGSDDVGDPNNSTSADDDTDEDEDEESESGTKTRSAGVGSDEMTSKTMENFESALQGLVDTETEHAYSRIPNVELDKIVVPMKEIHDLIAEFDSVHQIDAGAKEAYLKFRSEQKSIVSYLSKEFEMRKKADEHKRTKVAKTGILNPNKLHSYKFNEDLFLRSEVVTAGKNHGFIMYLDWSGSMHEDMGNTIDQLMLLSLFCKKINVPFEAYAFTDRWTEGDCYSSGGYHKFSKTQMNDIGLNENFHLLHLVSSALSTSKFQTSMTYLARLRMAYEDRYAAGHHDIPNKLQLGGTPLGECIITAINMVPEFQKKNNVQIVNTIFLTDGQGNDRFPTWNGTEFEGKYSRYSSIVIIDPVTKKHYDQRRLSSVGNLDSQLLKILADRTKARVIGFYIAPTRNKKVFKREVGYSGVEWSKQEEIWNDIKKNNFIVLEDTQGYDQYIWVSSKSLNIDSNDIAIDSDMTKGRMKNAFIKQRQGKFGNKVMLSKLAEFVS